MISKELLSEVLGCKLDIDEQLQPNEIEYIEKVGSRLYCRTINICKLQNKCRIWAYEQGYSFGTYLIDDKWYTVTEDNLFSTITYWHEDYSSIKLKLIDDYTSSTEPEAVFKSCQWILENKDK
jgi:hypothetical protein